MQPTLVKLNVIVLNGMYRIINLVFHNTLLISKQISGKLPTELQYVERNVFVKEDNTQKF